MEKLDNQYQWATIKQTKNSAWRCFLMGKQPYFVFQPSEGEEPNWFHRWMQRLCFGFVWVKA